MKALIGFLIIFALIGGGIALYYFVIKPRRATGGSTAKEGKAAKIGKRKLAQLSPQEQAVALAEKEHAATVKQAEKEHQGVVKEWDKRVSAAEKELAKA